jgi:hypothetical protein
MIRKRIRACTLSFGLIGTQIVARDTVANVDVSDGRCIGKLIASDPRLVASRQYRMGVTRHRVTCCRYIIPLFRRTPRWLHTLYKRPGMQWEGTIIESCCVPTDTKS